MILLPPPLRVPVRRFVAARPWLYNPKRAAGSCVTVSCMFVEDHADLGVDLRYLIGLRVPYPRRRRRSSFVARPGYRFYHVVVVAGSVVIDFTARQLDYRSPVPALSPVADLESRWSRVFHVEPTDEFLHAARP